MRFTELFVRTASLWPTVIDIRDGKLIGREGGFFPSLSKAWAEAEQAANALSELHGLMVWAMYGALHQRARAIFLMHNFELRLSECDKAEVQRRFEENLYSPIAGFEALWHHYLNDLPQA